MATKIPPGFRFHPTDVELLKYYLKRKILDRPVFEAIQEVSIYDFDPWELPTLSCLKTDDQKWYFFCSRERRYTHGDRARRSTRGGFWKTTGRDRRVMCNDECVGMIKTLIFHEGRAPRGIRTDWVMHEYRLEDPDLSARGIAQDTYVLCAIFKKKGLGPRNGAQYGALFREEDWQDDEISVALPSDLLAAASGSIQAPLPPQEEQQNCHAGDQDEANNGLPESIVMVGSPPPVFVASEAAVPEMDEAVLPEMDVPVLPTPTAMINPDNEAGVEGAVNDPDADVLDIDELLAMMDTPPANHNIQETQTAVAGPEAAATVVAAAAEGNGIFDDLPDLGVKLDGNWGSGNSFAFNRYDCFQEKGFMELQDLEPPFAGGVRTSPGNMQGAEVNMGSVGNRYPDKWGALD